MLELYRGRCASKQNDWYAAHGKSYKYSIFRTEWQVKSIRSFCDTIECIVHVMDTRPYKPDAKTTPLLPLGHQAPHEKSSSKALCFLHMVSGQCKRCLAQAVTGMESMYSSIIYFPKMRIRAVLTVILTKSIGIDESQNCHYRICGYNLAELSAELCRDTAQMNITGPSDNTKPMAAHENRKLKRKRKGNLIEKSKSGSKK